MPCFKNSEADQVELLLKEEWPTYVKNLDALILKACKLTDLQQEWKIQHLVPYLQKYLVLRDEKVSDPLSKHSQQALHDNVHLQSIAICYFDESAATASNDKTTNQ